MITAKDLLLTIRIIISMIKIKKTISIFTAFITAFSLLFPACVFADEEESYEKDSIYLETRIMKISNEGDIVLGLTEKALEEAGFSIGDEVKVVIKSYDYSEKMPYFTSDSDSEPDECALIMDGKTASLSTAKGCFAEDEDLLYSETGSDGKLVWEDEYGNNGAGVRVKVYLHEKGAYLEQYNMRNPERSNDRDDYSSGKKYANFREITAGTIGREVLFRSSSPINNAIGRSEYAAKRVEKAGIKTVVNLSDSRKEAEKYIHESGNTYYKSLLDKGNVLTLDLNYDFDSDSFKKGMADAVSFMSEHEGPYLIHCTEGKDRTGILSALLEAVMGASIREISDDYLSTYKNFYNYSSDSEEYDYAKDKYLKEIFRAIADADSNSELSGMDYHEAALDYLGDGGATDEKINKLIEKLKGKGENINNVLNFSVDKTATEEAKEAGGELKVKTGDRSVAVYSGAKVRPGKSSVIVNGDYLYNKRDYQISYKDNIHAGIMTAIVKFKKKTDIYDSGVKKMILSYKIEPKKVKEDDVRVRLNKKGTDVKLVRDLERGERIKEKYYSVDMKSRKVTFNGDYSGVVSF